MKQINEALVSTPLMLELIEESQAAQYCARVHFDIHVHLQGLN